MGSRRTNHPVSCFPAGSIVTAHIRCRSDVSVQVDDFAAYRQPTLKDSEDTSILHPLEVQARKAGLFYHKVEGGGNIGCYGYGAGVAMSTMDALVAAGGAVGALLSCCC